jgi:predicted exporter
VALAAVAVVTLSAFGATRLTFDTDVSSLLPRTGRVIPAFRTFIEHFGSLDELYVVFTAPAGHAISDYGDDIEAWVQRLRATPEIVRVDAGVVDPSRDLEWLANRQLLLLRGETLDTALRRFKGADMRAALASRRDLLAVPSASVTDVVRHDPLGLYDLVREQLGATQAGVNLGVTEDGYMTPDSRSRLVIAHPVRPPFDTEFSRALAAALDRMRREIAPAKADAPESDALPPMQVEFAGGHAIAVETESVVRRESILNTVASLALILPLLFLVFRSLWLVVVGPVPAAVSLAIVLGMLGLAATTLSAAATASAAMLFGLGIDGVVLLYVVHTLALREGSTAGDSIDHLSGPATSMLLGTWTTAATFYGLTFVDFPSLQQLGALIGHSMVLCGIVTLVLVPALLPRRAAARESKLLSMPGLARWIQQRKLMILAVAAVVTPALGAAALNIDINPTLDRLRSVTPAAVSLERIAPRFGLPYDVYLVLQRGADLDRLLAVNERLARDIGTAMPAAGFQAASALLPSQASQNERAAAIRRAGLSAGDVAIDLDAAAVAEGFRNSSLAEFRHRLPRLLATDARLTYDEYRAHGLSDLIGRFVRRAGPEWLIVSYASLSSDSDAVRLQQIVAGSGDGAVLTGLPLVNRELAERFTPQFLRGLAIGTSVVLVLILAAFRDWRLSLLSLVPAVLGLIWAAGVIALARIELDLFAVFAVVTFVGIGVDYGVHLVHRYRDRRDAGRAIAELAPVILVAAAITLLGYGTLVASSYPPLRSIGLVSIVAVVTLAAASVIVMPALLPGPSPAQAPAGGDA